MKRKMSKQLDIESIIRNDEREKIAALLDVVGRDWRDKGQIEKFYAVNYLVEKVLSTDSDL